MKKSARKPSDDPAQERLRQKKQDWNSDVSTVISQLIAFKRGINGKGDDRAALPPSSIKDPFPDEIIMYKNDLDNRFQGIINEVNQIIEEQRQYSENRRKSAVASRVAMIKLSSWWGSRAWSWIKQFPLAMVTNDDITKNRIKMLYSLANARDSLNDIEYKLTSNDKNAIQQSFYSLKEFLNLFEDKFIKTTIETFEKYKNVVDKKIEDDKLPQPPPPTVEDSKAPTGDKVPAEAEDKKSKALYIASELTSAEALAINLGEEPQHLEFKKGLVKLRHIIEQYAHEAIAQAKPSVSLEEIDTLRKHLLSLYNNIVGENKESFQDYVQKTASLNKLAKRQFGRFFNRFKYMFKRNELSKKILDTALNLRAAAMQADKCMDLLENKSSSVQFIAKNIADLFLKIKKVLDDYVVLAEQHRSDYRQQSSNRKGDRLLLIESADVREMMKRSNKLLEYASQFTDELNDEADKKNDKDNNKKQ